MIDQHLLDSIADLEAIVEDAATYAAAIEKNQRHYEGLRQYFTLTPKISDIAPEFLVRHKALGQVRRHFQNVSGRYAERRQRLRDDLEPLYLLATGRPTQSDLSTVPPGASGHERPAPSSPTVSAVAPPIKRDLFLSHASEDKPFARDVLAALEGLGYSVWFDEFEILVGDNVPNSVARGLQNARYGVVVVSPNFLGKQWTDAELSAMFSIGMGRGAMSILPVLYGISHGTLAQEYPLIASLLAVDATKLGAIGTADAIGKRVDRDRRALWTRGIT